MLSANLRKQFGKYLKDKRMAAGLSQADVTKELNYTSPQFLSNCERGEALLPLAKLRILASIYQIPKQEMIRVLIGMQEKQIREEFGIAQDTKRIESYKHRRARK